LIFVFAKIKFIENGLENSFLTVSCKNTSGLFAYNRLQTLKSIWKRKQILINRIPGRPHYIFAS